MTLVKDQGREESADTAPRRKLSERMRSLNASLFANWRLRSVQSVGKKPRVYGSIAVNNWGKMRIGDNVQIISDISTVELSTFLDGKLRIGNHVFINRGTSIVAVKQVTIGNDCHIGTDVSIMDNSFHRLEPERRNEMPASQTVTIGDQVWLGNRVMVMPGVTIGRGSAIGAGSIVTQDIPERSLAVGIPAKVIRQL